MTHTEKRYAQERIQQITRQHEAAIEADIKQRQQPQMTPEAKLKMIRDGSAALVGNRVQMAGKYRDVPSLLDVFDFPGESSIDKHNEKLEIERIARIDKLRSASSTLRDELVLGDGKDALAKLKTFTSAKF